MSTRRRDRRVARYYNGRPVDGMNREELLRVVEELARRSYQLAVEKYDLERVLREVAGDKVADEVLLLDGKGPRIRRHGRG